MANNSFSDDLESWVKDHRPKTLGNLSKVFNQKSFAIVILLLIAPSALPIPTGGFTNVLEIIVMLLALQLMIGKKAIWLPKRWLKISITGKAEEKIIPAIAKKVKWIERFSRPRLVGVLHDPKFLKATGLIIFVLAFATFFTPPFTGLDTLPSLGIALICLSLILEDALLYIVGCFVGGVGVSLAIGVGKGLIEVAKAVF